MNNNDFNFCVWSMNGDFLETFKTLKEAFSFCKRHFFNGLIVGRWDRDENGDYLDTYTSIKNYPSYQARGKGGARTQHYKNIALSDFLGAFSNDFEVTFYSYNYLVWTHKNDIAQTTSTAGTIKNFFSVVDRKKRFIEIWNYNDNYLIA